MSTLSVFNCCIRQLVVILAYLAVSSYAQNGRQGQQQQQQQVAAAASRPAIVLFGDSITEFGFTEPSGWVSSLAAAYSRRADVVNRGMAGWNTRMAARVLPATLAQLTGGAGDGQKRVVLLTIWFGANDAVQPGGKE
jgi:lysophospholipase L1-like esterase